MVKIKYASFPLGFALQKFVLYETKAVCAWRLKAGDELAEESNTIQRFYLVGSDRQKTRYHVLKIDRTSYDEVSNCYHIILHLDKL